MQASKDIDILNIRSALKALAKIEFFPKSREWNFRRLIL